MDQPAGGRAIERLGAGRVLPKTAGAARGRKAVEVLLRDDAMRAAAVGVGRAARERDGADVAVDLLERRSTRVASG